MAVTKTASSFDPRGGFKELFVLFFPILLTTFSNCLFLFIEKLFLSRVSVLEMEAAVSVAYACQIFQAPCIAVAMMAQVLVGRYRGAMNWNSIGPGMWQFIWFSFLSMFLTVPISILYGKYYFHGTAIESVALPYFYLLISINFLFPLGIALSSFYLGQGKTRLILFSTIATQLIKLVLAYYLIFGIPNFIPPLGLMGGALSTLVAQGAFCLFLFFIFLNSKHRELYAIKDYVFRPKLFWQCINPGLLRAGSRILTLTCWASVAHLMSAKGGDYLLTLSIGGIILIFLPFLGEAICQAQTTVVSHLLGAKHNQYLAVSFRSGTLLVLLTAAVIAIPLLIFPVETYQYLFSAIPLDPWFIRKVFLGVWMNSVFYTFCLVPISFILAFQDTKFTLYMGIIGWFTGYLYMYFMLEKIKILPTQFWLFWTVYHALNALLYYWRMRGLQDKESVVATVTISPKKITG